MQTEDNTESMDRRIAALQAMLPAERPFDIIVSDIELANGSIMPILQKHQSFIASFPTILITSDKSIEVIHLAEQIGVFDVLSKPFDLPFLFATICHAVAGRKEKENLSGSPLHQAESGPVGTKR